MLALMAHHNTNDPEMKMLPAKVIYGRRVTDAFKFMTGTDKFSDEAGQPTWRQARELKEHKQPPASSPGPLTLTLAEAESPLRKPG